MGRIALKGGVRPLVASAGRVLTAGAKEGALRPWQRRRESRSHEGPAAQGASCGPLSWNRPL